MTYPVTNKHINDLSDELIAGANAIANREHPMLPLLDRRSLALAGLMMGSVKLCFTIGVLDRVLRAEGVTDNHELLQRVHAICNEPDSRQKMYDAYHAIVNIMADLAPLKVEDAADGMPDN